MSQAYIPRALQTGFLLVFGLLALLGYGKSLDAPLMFDSVPSVGDNRHLQISGAEFDEWRTAAFSFQGSPIGRPLSMLTFAANFVVQDSLSVGQLRAVNLGIHFLCAALLYFTVLTLLSKAVTVELDRSKVHFVATVASLIWLLHPLNVSTVLYVVQRMTQLSTVFVLLGLWVFSTQRGNWCHRQPNAGEVVGLGLWLLLITWLAVLSKENGILLLWLLPALEVCFFRGQWGGQHNKWISGLAWCALIAPALLVIVLVFVEKMPFLGSYEQRPFTLLERLLSQVRVLWHYVYWLLLPNLKAMALHHDDIALSKSLLQPMTTVLSLAAWVFTVIMAFFMRRRDPVVFFCVLFFLITHFLESSVLPLELAWEHRNYLPGMSLALLLAWFGARLLSRATVAQRWGAVIAVLCLMSVLLHLRTDRWSDELTLSQTNVLNHPQSVRANYHYANTLYRNYDSTDTSTENGESLLLSRHFYELMYQLDNNDIAAIISLYYLDERHFSVLQQKVDWFAKLEVAATERAFTFADFNALNLLSDCVDNGGCTIEPHRLLNFYRQLTARYPYKVQVWILLSRYQSRVLGDDTAALEAIDAALLVSPHSVAASNELIVLRDQTQDAGGVISAIANLMASDKSRLELGRVQLMLGLEAPQ